MERETWPVKIVMNGKNWQRNTRERIMRYSLEGTDATAWAWGTRRGDELTVYIDANCEAEEGGRFEQVVHGNESFYIPLCWIR